MIEKIKWLIKLYQEGYQINNLKLVVNNATYQEIILCEDFKTEKDKPSTFMNIPIELNDKIATDFYVTERI